MVPIKLSIQQFHATSLMRGEKRERPGIQGVNREAMDGEAGCFTLGKGRISDHVRQDIAYNRGRV